MCPAKLSKPPPPCKKLRRCPPWKRNCAAPALLAGAQRASAAGSKPLSMKEIQSEVNTVRRERKAKGGKTA